MGKKVVHPRNLPINLMNVRIGIPREVFPQVVVLTKTQIHPLDIIDVIVVLMDIMFAVNSISVTPSKNWYKAGLLRNPNLKSRSMIYTCQERKTKHE